MPHHNPKKKRKLTEDQKVMKFCSDYRARAWRRVRAIVGPDMDDQIDYQPGGTVQKHRGPRLRTFVKRPSTVQRYYVGRRYSVNFTFLL